MASQGMVSATSGAGTPTPPHNPLLRILYEQQRITLGPIAGIAEEAQLRSQGYDPQPWSQALISGFREAKTFDNVTDNPWLAFALNVGADPVTWIPGSWITKGTKAAGAIIGADKALKYAKGIEAIDKLDTWWGTKFRGPLYELRKRNPKAVADLFMQRRIDFDDFISTFVADQAQQMTHLVSSDQEMMDLQELLKVKPYARTLADSMNKMSPQVVAMYDKLTPGGKTAYRLAWETERALQGIRASRDMRALDTWQALRDRIAEQYKTFSATPHEALANEAELNGVLSQLGANPTAKDIVRKLTPDQAALAITDLIPDIKKEYKGLATMAVTANSFREFSRAVKGLQPGTVERGVVEMIHRDQSILKLRELAGMYQMGDLPPEAMEAIARMSANESNVDTSDAQKILAWLIQQPGKSEARTTWEKLAGKKIVPAFTRAGTLREDAFPLARDVKKVLEKMPLSTDYKNLSHFYQDMRYKTRINEEPLVDALKHLGKTMPPELQPTMTLDEIKQIREQLLGMRTPEAIAQSRDVWDKLNKNRFNGLPLNVIRNSNIDQIAKINLDEIGVRMAQALQVDGIVTANAVAHDNLHRSLFQWLHKKELLLPIEHFDDLKLRTEFFRNLKNVLPAEEYAARAREGFAKVTGHPIFSGFAIPKTLASEINSFTNVASNPKTAEKFFQFWGRYQGLWKAYQLAIFPSYHARNAVSNVWNNFLFGLGAHPGDIKYYKRAFEIQKKMGLAVLGGSKGKFPAGLAPEEIELIRNLRRGVIGGEYSGELQNVLDAANPFQNRNWLTRSPLIKGGFNVGRDIEDNARIAHYLKATDGMKMSHLDAVRSVEKYLFNWRGGLTKFEDKYMRNFLVPFYGWTRFNLPLQMEMLAMQMGKFSSVSKLKSAYEKQWGGPDPDTQFQADWFKEAFNVRVRYNQDTGSYEYFFLDQWLPAADVSKVLSLPLFRDTIIQLLSPGIKTVPIEILFNYDLFKKRKISEYEGETVPIHLPGGKTVHLNASVEHLLRQMRLVNEIDRFFDESTNLSSDARWQRIFVGRSYPYDPAQQENWWRFKLNTQIRELEGFYAKAIDHGDEKEAERILDKLDKARELQAYYK